MGALAYSEKYTVTDYERWEGDWELVNGTPYAMAPSPMVTHQSVVTKIARHLDEQMDECNSCFVLSETDWTVSEETVVRPDCMVVCNIEGEKVLKTPNIIFEVISKGNSKRDEVLKFDLYQSEGVKYYCIVYPEYKKAKLFKLKDGRLIKEGDYSSESYTFDGLECEVKFDFSKIWRKPIL